MANEEQTAEQAARAEEERQRARLEQVLAQVNAQMVHVQGGTFRMGGKEGTFSLDGAPAHWVEVSSFEISRYEVTQEIWEAVMGENPSHFQAGRSGDSIRGEQQSGGRGLVSEQQRKTDPSSGAEASERVGFI